MKFSDGYWLPRRGFSVHRPTELAEAVAGARSLTVLAPTKPSTGRGWDLNLPTATITLSTPMRNVIRVRIEHHAGALDPGPHFELPGEQVEQPADIEIDDETASFASGGLTARINRTNPLQIDFCAGDDILTSSLPRGIGLATDDKGTAYVFQQLSLAVGDLVYGLGERFGPVVKNGQSVDIWNEDGGTASEQAYKNVPFFLTNAGYGVLVNHPERVSFEIGSETVSRTQFSVSGEHLEYFVILGPTPKEILSRYTALTGRPPAVPNWSFGLWLSTSFTTSYDEQTVSGFIDEMAERDIPLSVFQWDMWQAGMALVDFTNPDALAWYTGHLGRLLDQGVDAFKTVFGERVPTDVVWFDGSDPQRMHNYYAQAYNKAVFDLLRERRGEGEAVVFARSATTGGQQFPVHWGGDSESTYSSMAETLRGGLSLAYSGFGYWSHDIGGFEGTPDPAVFKRWLAFGMLSSHSRLHGSGSVRVPWAFGDEAVDVARKFVKLKLSLMPYLSRIAAEATIFGYPMMRPMLLEFPADRAVQHLDTQYMLGDSLLVAPVFSAEGEVEFYVPEGVWTHLLTGEKIIGPRWVRQQHGYDSLPLLVRPGTVLPIGAHDDSTEYDFAEDVALHLFEIPDGLATELHIGDTRFAVARSGGSITAHRTSGDGSFSLTLDDVVARTESDHVTVAVR